MSTFVIFYGFVAWVIWYPLARAAGDPSSLKNVTRSGVAAVCWPILGVALALLALYELSGMIWRAILGEHR